MNDPQNLKHKISTALLNENEQEATQLLLENFDQLPKNIQQELMLTLFQDALNKNHEEKDFAKFSVAFKEFASMYLEAKQKSQA